MHNHDGFCHANISLVCTGTWQIKSLNLERRGACASCCVCFCAQHIVVDTGCRAIVAVQYQHNNSHWGQQFHRLFFLFSFTFFFFLAAAEVEKRRARQKQAVISLRICHSQSHQVSKVEKVQPTRYCNGQHCPQVATGRNSFIFLGRRARATKLSILVAPLTITPICPI